VVNAIGPSLPAEALRPALAKAKGLIINKSAMASDMPQTAYGITMAGLNVFTHAMASREGSFINNQVSCATTATIGVVLPTLSLPIPSP
jgi:NAD(P)-dependent dehydrogenase (short-subunit alcohol dehydrogenase family)